MEKQKKPIRKLSEEQKRQYCFNRAEKRFSGKEEGRDYIVCKICNIKCSSLVFHVVSVHGLSSASEYLKGHPGPIVCTSLHDKLSESVKGEKNPAYQHGGKFSPFSKRFVHSGRYDPSELAKRAQRTAKKNGNSQTTAEYFIKRGATEEEAKRLLTERQTTFSLQKCIERYGEEKGRERWLQRQEKWQKSFKKSNFSLISQDLFWSIVPDLKDLSRVYFAQLDENKRYDDSGVNHEYTLVLERAVKPDFIDLNKKKIIEFDGTYWHRTDGRGNRERDKRRDDLLRKNGYQVLHVDEIDFKRNEERVVRECLDFLNL